MPKKIEGYSAEITVDNKASKQLERIIKDNQKLNNEMIRLRNNMDRVSAKKMRVKVEDKELTKLQKTLNHLKKPVHVSIKVASSAGSALKGILKDLTSIQAMAGGIAIGYGLSNVYEKTVGKAMSVQLESTVLRSMAKTRGLNGADIERQLRARALKSILSEEEFIGAGRAFIPYSGSTKQVMQLTSLAERLGLYDPEQGLAGAKFAMKELLSGESKSLRTRFELPAKSIKDLEKFVDKVDMQKPQNIDKFIGLLDKTLSSAGIGGNFIQQIESTPYAQSQMFQEYIVKGLSMMGNKVLPDVNKKLAEFNKRLDSGGLNKFVKVGSKGLKFLTDSILMLVDTIDSKGPQIEKWFDNTFSFLNSTLQDIKSGKKTFGDVATEVLNKILTSINQWIKDNREAISSTTGTIVGVMANGISQNAGVVASAGASLAGSLISGFTSALASHPFLAMVVGAYQGGKFGIPGAVLGAFAGLETSIQGNLSIQREARNKLGVSTDYKAITGKSSTSTHTLHDPRKITKRAVGGKIPYDNFPALLHEGETVLTKQESKGTGGSFSLAKLADNIIVREDADIDKIVTKLVRRLKNEQVAFGGEF